MTTFGNFGLPANIPEDIRDVNNTGSPPWGNTPGPGRGPYQPPLPALRAPLGKSDHALLLLIPQYKHKLDSVKKTSKSVRS